MCLSRVNEVRRLVLFAAVFLVVVPAAGAATGNVTEFPLPDPGDHPADAITAGFDGNMWFTQADFNASTGNLVGVMTTSGVLRQQFPTPLVGKSPYGIAAGPDGNVWYTDTTSSEILRLTPTGATTAYVLGHNTYPWAITPGSDGNMWFTEYGGRKIGRITPSGVVTEFPTGGTLTSVPSVGLTAGADGNLWFTEDHPSEFVGRITPDGVVTEFPLSGNVDPRGIAAGPDGNLWVAELNANKILRVTPTGAMTSFPLPSAAGGPFGIAPGSDGALWFTGGKLGRITTGGVVTEYPAVVGDTNDVAIGPDGNLWFPASSIGRISVARAGVGYVLSLDGAFVPSRRGARLGGMVQWTFDGARVHEVSDSSGMGLFDSGPNALVSFFNYTFTAAGSYAYRDTLNPTLTGTISVPLGVSPASGTATSAFTITWASTPAATGFAYDVQIKRPGTTSYLDWQTGATSPSATFTPDAGSGTYSFRARLRKTGNGKSSGWSSGKTITVS
jgi:streptogramin lyase